MQAVSLENLVDWRMTTRKGRGAWLGPVRANQPNGSITLDQDDVGGNLGNPAATPVPPY